MSKHSELLVKTYTSLNEFDNENSKYLIEILDECMKLEVEPNLISEQLAIRGKQFVDDLISKLENDINGTYYVQIIKICTLQTEIHQWILRDEVLK